MLCYWMYFLNSPSHENSEMVLWSCAVVIVVQSLICVPHGLQHARLPCPSPTPRACSNSCPSSWWCHPIILCHPLLPLPSISPSVRVFFNESVLHIRWPKYWSFSSASVLPKSIQGILGLTDWIFLQCKGLSRVFSNPTVQKHQFFGTQGSLWSNSPICTWLLEKPYIWLYRPSSAK